MGPTERSKSSATNFNGESCPESSSSSQTNNGNETYNETLDEDWGTVIKLKLPLSSDSLSDNLPDYFKRKVETIQKLSRLSSPPKELVQYRKFWFEGPLSDKLNNSYSVSKPKRICEGDSESTFLCIQMEHVEKITLQNWLDERKDHFLHEGQIAHIILQVLTAIKALLENDINLHNDLDYSNIYIILGKLNASELSPKVKLDCIGLDFLESERSNVNEGNFQNSFKFLTDMYLKLLQINITTTVSEIDGVAKTLESNYPEELKIIHEFDQDNITVFAITGILQKLNNLVEKYFTGILFNINQPLKNYVGRQEEINQIMKIVTGETKIENNIVVIKGSSGLGKTEMINRLCRILQDSDDKKSKSTQVTNIFCFNGSSVDKLTSSVMQCSAHSKLNILTKDYTGNCRNLKEIFQSILLACSEQNCLLIFDNANMPSEEMIDLLDTFQEHSKTEQLSSQCRQYLIIVMKELWTNNEILNESKVISLSSLNLKDSTIFLQNNLNLDCTLEELVELAKILQNHPAALQLVIAYTKAVSLSDFHDILPSLHKFIQNCSGESISGDDADTSSSLNQTTTTPTCLIYSMSLNYLFESFNEVDKLLMDKTLFFLQYIDGESGITVKTLYEIFKRLPELQKDNILTMESLKSLLNTFSKFSLISFRDEVIRLPYWMQEVLKESLRLLKKDNQSIEDVFSALQTILLTLPITEVSEVIFHVTKMWIVMAGNAPLLAKQFESTPELVSKLAKDSDKFEEVTGFLKQAADILSQAYNNPYNLQTLKLRFQLGVQSLLPKSKINEAFIIFKTIQEQSRTEPREFLNLKLKSLIELGKIHIIRQEYEKAISCFQQVQIFAVQKISTIELDSEITLLQARMFHGYVHFLQSNFAEGKKILLQVIPLMERYQGPDLDQVRNILLQARFYLACILRKSGDLINALMIQTKVLEERELKFGQRHPDTWSSKQEMAMLYSSYDNHDKALVILRELLETQEEVLGAPSNRQSLATMNSIAEIELKLGNFDDALELYEAIDLIEQEVLPEQDEMRISTQLNQAEVLMSLGQYKEAVDIFDLVYTLRSTCTSEDSKSSRNLQLCEDILAKKEKAGRSMEILGNYWLSLTPENVDDPSELSALAKKHEVSIELTENQDNHGALRFLREVIEDSGTNLEDTNRFLLNVKADLARVLGLVGKFNESFSVYKEIIPLMDATFGETDELTMLCKDTMGQVFLFSGNQFLKRQMSNLKWFMF